MFSGAEPDAAVEAHEVALEVLDGPRSEVARVKTKPRPRLLSATGHFLLDRCARPSSSRSARWLPIRSMSGRDRWSAGRGRRPASREARASPCCCQQSWKRPRATSPCSRRGRAARAFRLAVLSLPGREEPLSKGAPPPASGNTRALDLDGGVDAAVDAVNSSTRKSASRIVRSRGTGASPSRPRRRSRARGRRAPQRAACRARSAGAQAASARHHRSAA